MILSPHTYYLAHVRVVKNTKIRKMFSCLAIFLSLNEGVRLPRHWASQILNFFSCSDWFSRNYHAPATLPTNHRSRRNSRFGSPNASVGAHSHSWMKRLLNSWTFLGFSCSSRLLRALNNMYVEWISLGYMKMAIFSGLRTFACEGRSNGGVMFGSGGDECAAFASLKRV